MITRLGWGLVAVIVHLADMGVELVSCATVPVDMRGGNGTGATITVPPPFAAMLPNDNCRLQKKLRKSS